MPDDRPESPEERLRTALREIRGIARTFVEDARVRERIDRIARAALSTPAGPSPQWCATCEGDGMVSKPEGNVTCPDCNGTQIAAPSSREEAVEARSVRGGVCLLCGSGVLASGEHLRDDMEPCYGSTPAALSAARPSSPTPEETP